jgi:ubiquinone/menaquinone biosynthesis C-methylase UbiE
VPIGNSCDGASRTVPDDILPDLGSAAMRRASLGEWLSRKKTARIAGAMVRNWMDCDCEFIARRYDHLANLIVLFEWLLFVPAQFRRSAVKALELKRGDRVLEIGCGTGRNLQNLREAVGPRGHVYGVDLSDGMLNKARRIVARHGWKNVTLVHSDAVDYQAPEPLDAVLFGFSYNTIPHHLAVLDHALAQLRLGGQLCVMDAKLPPGRLGKIILPLSVWLMQRTLLGNPYIHPWEHVAQTTRQFQIKHYRLSSYYICQGKKYAQTTIEHSANRAPKRVASLWPHMEAAE